MEYENLLKQFRINSMKPNHEIFQYMILNKNMRPPNPLFKNDTTTNESKKVILFELTIDKQLTSKLDIISC